MSDYSKLWSNFLGAAAGLALAYFTVPEQFEALVPVLMTSLIPIIGGMLGTYLGPKNTN